MTNNEKAAMYDNLIRESDRLQRVNSRLKSDYPFNMPVDIQRQVNENNKKITDLVKKLEDLMR